MARAKALVLRTAGTNCDYETQKAFELAGAKAYRIHINEIISKKAKLKDFDILSIPGGFSYGDDIASGRILSNELKYRVKEEMYSFAENGNPIIGICNGFQVLVKMGLLPGEKDFRQNTTLTYNDSDKFECRWVNLKKVQNLKCKTQRFWAKKLPEIIQLPVAHGEGKFVCEDLRLLKDLEANSQVVFKYVDEKGKYGPYPYNPNGAVNSIAGICNKKGNVFGLMPHPERYVYAIQHPNREAVKNKSSEGWGLQIFKNAVDYVK